VKKYEIPASTHIRVHLGDFVWRAVFSGVAFHFSLNPDRARNRSSVCARGAATTRAIPHGARTRRRSRMKPNFRFSCAA